MDEKEILRIETPPKAAGAYWVGGFTAIEVRQRPGWFHRFAMRVFFGWQWRDAPRAPEKP
jgi:hypothetical protein